MARDDLDALIATRGEPSAEDTREARRVAYHIVMHCLRSGCDYGIQFTEQRVAAIIAWQVSAVLREHGMSRRYQMTVEQRGNAWWVLAGERQEGGGDGA